MVGSREGGSRADGQNDDNDGAEANTSIGSMHSLYSTVCSIKRSLFETEDISKQSELNGTALSF
jgi:hypothetical protein